MDPIYYVEALQRALELPSGQHLKMTCMTLDEADERANQFLRIRDAHREFRTLEIKTDGMDIVIRNLVLDVGSCCSLEVSSEEDGYPIEAAVQPEASAGWRAAVPGTQTVRLIFDEPQNIRRIWLVFEELENTRTQEFVLRSHSDKGNFREIVRQQWNFSPSGSVQEIEDYAVELFDVKVLEIVIVPDKSGGEALAGLRRLCLA